MTQSAPHGNGVGGYAVRVPPLPVPLPDPGQHTSRAPEPEQNRPRSVRGMMAHYGAAILCIFLVLEVRLLLDPFLGTRFPFIVFLCAVLLVAWFSGLGPSLAATVLGFLSVDYFFLEPRHQQDGAEEHDE